jgi:preprotein translocase subunit SecE
LPVKIPLEENPVAKAENKPPVKKTAEKKLAEKKPAEKRTAEKRTAEKKIERKTPSKQPNAIQRYWRETIGELRKVTWPTRKEATNLTIIVLVVIVGMSAFLGLLDFVFSQTFAFILK